MTRTLLFATSATLFTATTLAINEGIPENQVPSEISGYDGQLCKSPNNVFTAQVNLFAGELGYYIFEECGMDVMNPSIAMEIGETYTFVQKHRNNYFHAIGFAYSPYGDEELKIEVEPGNSFGDQSCVEDLTCPAPMYYLNETYLGHYSNNPTLTGNITRHEEDFGLDVYEPLFFRNPHEWTQFGTFNIKFRVDDPTISRDMFYFCHIHEFMGGRIKTTQNGKVINPMDIPSLGFAYDYETPLLSDFDKECGTYALGDFQLPHPLCPDKFVCLPEEDPYAALGKSASEITGVNVELHKFIQCIDAMNCQMLAGMTTGIKAQDERALFIHQMIPHHQNAVNMAKALLKADKTKCPDLADDEDPDCILEGILYEIVNTQNLQIQAMYDYLDAKRMPEKDNCDVLVETVTAPPKEASHAGRSSTGVGLGAAAIMALLAFAF